MATFLTTPQMSPELRARVERAVSHRTRARHHAKKLEMSGTFASRPRSLVVRLLPLMVLLLVAGLGSAVHVHERGLFEEDRASLLASVEERRAGLPPGYDGLLAQVEPWIVESAAEAAPADEIAPELREPGALDGWLGRPALYVRGPAAELRAAPGQVGRAFVRTARDDAEAASTKDAFLLCLMFPPASAAERDLLASVRGVYFGGVKVEEQTANVRLLGEARVGLQVVGPDFEAQVRAAEEVLQLKKLRKDLQAAPAEAAAKAARAELLIVVAEEPASAGVRSARVALVDLAANRLLARVKTRVPPAGSSTLATLHREHLEGCGLALSVRGGVEE